MKNVSGIFWTFVFLLCIVAGVGFRSFTEWKRITAPAEPVPPQGERIVAVVYDKSKQTDFQRRVLDKVVEAEAALAKKNLTLGVVRLDLSDPAGELKGARKEYPVDVLKAKIQEHYDPPAGFPPDTVNLQLFELGTKPSEPPAFWMDSVYVEQDEEKRLNLAFYAYATADVWQGRLIPHVEREKPVRFTAQDYLKWAEVVGAAFVLAWVMIVISRGSILFGLPRWTGGIRGGKP